MVFKEYTYIETYVILTASISTFHPIWDSSFRKQERQNAMLNIAVLAFKETECSDDPSLTSITVPYYCTEYLYFTTVIIMKFVRQIVKGHCRQSQDSLLTATVLNVMQIESLVPPGCKEMPVVGGRLFSEIWRPPRQLLWSLRSRWV